MVTRLPQDDYQKTALRLPRDLHARINAAAESNGRSMNAEIIARLQQSLAEDKLSPGRTEISRSVTHGQLGLAVQQAENRVMALDSRLLSLMTFQQGMRLELPVAQASHNEAETARLRKAMKEVQSRIDRTEVELHAAIEQYSELAALAEMPPRVLSEQHLLKAKPSRPKTKNAP